MPELASLLAAYAAFALLYAADGPRLRPATQAHVQRPRIVQGALRGLAVVAFGLSTWYWSRVEHGAAVLLVPLAALMAAASLFVLLAPVAPRLVWVPALLCPPLVFLCVVFEVGHG